MGGMVYGERPNSSQYLVSRISKTFMDREVEENKWKTKFTTYWSVRDSRIHLCNVKYTQKLAEKGKDYYIVMQ